MERLFACDTVHQRVAHSAQNHRAARVLQRCRDRLGGSISLEKSEF